MVDLSKYMQDMATLEVIEKSAHDIEAYRGALGYSVSGEHDGRLSDGTVPNNGIAEALNNQCRTLSAQNSYQAMRIEGLERENAALRTLLGQCKAAMFESMAANARGIQTDWSNIIAAIDAARKP
jgi:hypothetical protein